MLARLWRKGNPFALLVEVQTSVATVESSVEIPQKIKNGSAFWPSDPTFGVIFEGTQNTNSKEPKHPYVRCRVIYNHQDMEVVQVSISRWVDKTTVGHLHNGIPLVHKKENFSLCDSMDGPAEHYAKWNKAVRERQIAYDFTHMWNPMIKPNKQAKQRQTHRWWAGKLRGGVKGPMDMHNRVVIALGRWV